MPAHWPCVGNMNGCAVTEDKIDKSRSAQQPRGEQNHFRNDEIAAEKRALRLLLDSFHTEKETLLDETLNDPRVRRKVGKVISQSFLHPHWPGDRR